MPYKIHHKIKKAIGTPEYLRIFTLRLVGNILILSSLFMLFKTFNQPVREEIRYFIDNRAQKKYIVTDVKNIDRIKRDYSGEQSKGLLSQALNLKSVEVMVPIDVNFSVVIPKIAANAKVVPGVNPGDEQVYLKALKQGVAHAEGTAYPGEKGHIFLFAHSTDYFWNVGTYNAVFYLLYKLEKDDEIDLFYKGNRYRYKVVGNKIVDPSEIEYLIRKTDKEFLTLQTCWPLGTAFKRLLVFGERVVE